MSGVAELNTSRTCKFCCSNKHPSLLTYNCQVELHVPGGGVPVVHPAPVDPLVHQAHGLDHQRCSPLLGSSAGESEVGSAAEAKCWFC